MIEDDKIMVDVAAAGTVLATLAGWLPVIAAALAIVWYLFRIAESPMFQAIIRKTLGVDLAKWIKQETPKNGTEG